MTSVILDLSTIDRSVKPADDFYDYAVGGWVKQARIPADKPEWNFFIERNEKNLELMRGILEAGEEEKSSTLYALGLDENRIELEGIKPLKAEFERIEKLKTKTELTALIAHEHLYTSSPFFDFSASQDPANSALMIGFAWQGGLTLPNRDYYLDKSSKPIRNKYRAHLQKVFGLLGEKPNQSRKDAAIVLKIETELARASMDKVDLRDPHKTLHKMSVDQLAKLAPTINWRSYFSELGVGGQKTLNVGQPEFFKGLDRILKHYSLHDLKIYLRWQLIAAFSPYLNKDFVDADFEFFKKTFLGLKAQPPRWKRMVGLVNGVLGEAAGKVYVKKYFPAASKAKMLTLVHNVIEATRVRIKKLDWMEEKTKREALKKLDRITIKIGYPDKWRDYSKLEIKNDSFIANLLRANYFESRRELDKIGRPTDRQEWHMPPQTVNAYYSPPNNEIVFPAGILQPIMFNPEADDAVNYGAIGSVIAHEVTHGFDDQGRKYDADGNLRDWWTKNDDKRFRERTKRLVKQFSGYAAIDNEKINGELTLGENIADLGGLNISLTALENTLKGKGKKVIDGLTPEQRFFLAFAQAWKDKTRPEYERYKVKIDPHSPPRFRVNGPLANLPEFATAFSISEESEMVLPANKRTKIW